MEQTHRNRLADALSYLLWAAWNLRAPAGELDRAYRMVEGPDVWHTFRADVGALRPMIENGIGRLLEGPDPLSVSQLEQAQRALEELEALEAAVAGVGE